MANSNVSPLTQLEETLDLYFGKKAPALPTAWKEVIVKFAPWLTLFFLILSLPALLAVFGIGALLSPFSFLGGANGGVTYLVSMVLLAVSVVLEALAVPGLFKRSKSGWKFIFYSTLVSLLSNVVSFNLGGIVIGGLISFYILFQIKSYYK